MRNVRKKSNSATAVNPLLIELQRSCSRALDRYIRAAAKARSFMMEAEQNPLPSDLRETLLEHLRTETCAHDAYMRARRRLWNSLAGSGERQQDVLKLAA